MGPVRFPRETCTPRCRSNRYRGEHKSTFRRSLRIGLPGTDIQPPTRSHPWLCKLGRKPFHRQSRRWNCHICAEGTRCIGRGFAHGVINDSIQVVIEAITQFLGRRGKTTRVRNAEFSLARIPSSPLHCTSRTLEPGHSPTRCIAHHIRLEDRRLIRRSGFRADILVDVTITIVVMPCIFR